MTTPVVFRRGRSLAADPPVELRFVDMLLIIIATLMIVTILFSLISAITGSGRPDTAPAVTTRSAPAAIAGQPYQLTLAGHGGNGDYRWEQVDGRLPEGLQLAEGGFVEGTPSREGTGSLRVRVRDGSGRASEAQELTFAVRPSGAGNVAPPKPKIASAMMLLDDAAAGQVYRHRFTADSGTAPYQWRADGLPEGLELAPDGTLGGRPEPGSSTFTVIMTEAGGTAAELRVRLIVNEAPDSWFWWFLRLLGEIFKWVATGLLALQVVIMFWGVLFGRPETVVRGRTGIFGNRRY